MRVEASHQPPPVSCCRSCAVCAQLALPGAGTAGWGAAAAVCINNYVFLAAKRNRASRPTHLFKSSAKWSCSKRKAWRRRTHVTTLKLSTCSTAPLLLVATVHDSRRLRSTKTTASSTPAAERNCLVMGHSTCVHSLKVLPCAPLDTTRSTTHAAEPTTVLLLVLLVLLLVLVLVPALPTVAVLRSVVVTCTAAFETPRPRSLICTEVAGCAAESRLHGARGRVRPGGVVVGKVKAREDLDWRGSKVVWLHTSGTQGPQAQHQRLHLAMLPQVSPPACMAPPLLRTSSEASRCSTLRRQSSRLLWTDAHDSALRSLRRSTC